MDTLTVIIFLTTLWLLLGVIGCWRMYWGEVKVYHLLNNGDKRLSFKELFTINKMYHVYIIFLLYGLVSWLIVEIFLPTAWYYKIPKTPEIPEEPIDFGKMAN